MRIEFTITEVANREWVAEAKQQIKPRHVRGWTGKGTSPWSALLDAIYEAGVAGWIKE